MNADLNVFKTRCETGVSGVVSVSSACFVDVMSVNDSIHIGSVNQRDLVTSLLYIHIFII